MAPRFDGEYFDASYYERWYGNAQTRTASVSDVRRRADFAASYLKLLEVHVGTILDLGAGKGWWRSALRRHFPRADYTGVELSESACAEHGWLRGSVVDFDHGEPADFVLCIGVLQYLDARSARSAIQNLAKNTESALFLEVLTRGDWKHTVDRTRSDGAVYLREADWYRELLEPHFVNAGGGMFLAHDAEPVLFELECLPGPRAQ